MDVGQFTTYAYRQQHPVVQNRRPYQKMYFLGSYILDELFR